MTSRVIPATASIRSGSSIASERTPRACRLCARQRAAITRLSSAARRSACRNAETGEFLEIPSHELGSGVLVGP